MTTTTNAKSFTALELLTAKEGEQFKVSTDNGLYGTTVINHKGSLINARTGQALPLTAELLQTKFRSVNIEKELSLAAFLEAYKAGKKVKIEIGDQYRFLQKQESELPDYLSELFQNGPFAAFTSSEVMTMKELTEGKFYIAE